MGIYALVDWHVLTPGNPNDGSYSNYWDFWGYISYSNSGKEHMLYEICNEPNGVQWSEIEKYANGVIHMIREKDPNSLIIVGTP